MVALTHTRADTEIVVAVVVVELSLERHRGLSSGGGDWHQLGSYGLHTARQEFVLILLLLYNPLPAPTLYAHMEVLVNFLGVKFFF